MANLFQEFRLKDVVGVRDQHTDLVMLAREMLREPY
jgi:hypothetical protein